MKPQETKRQPAKSFQDLIVWQKAHQFVLAIYKLSNSFPNSEIYGLTSQIRRASVSVSANIAEGFKKKTKPDKAKFMNIAQSSLEECLYYIDTFKRFRIQQCLQFNASTRRDQQTVRSISFFYSEFWLLTSDF